MWLIYQMQTSDKSSVSLFLCYRAIFLGGSISETINIFIAYVFGNEVYNKTHESS